MKKKIAFMFICLFVCISLLQSVCFAEIQTVTGYIRAIQADSGYVRQYPIRYTLCGENEDRGLYVTPGNCVFVNSLVTRQNVIEFLNTAFESGCKITITYSGIGGGCYMNITSVKLVREQQY